MTRFHLRQASSCQQSFSFRKELCYSMNPMPVTMAGSENETSFAEYLRTKLIFLWPEEVGLLWSLLADDGSSPYAVDGGGNWKAPDSSMGLVVCRMLVLHCSWTLSCISSQYCILMDPQHWGTEQGNDWWVPSIIIESVWNLIDLHFSKINLSLELD